MNIVEFIVLAIGEYLIVEKKLFNVRIISKSYMKNHK
jgi:hypothetical protein